MSYELNEVYFGFSRFSLQRSFFLVKRSKFLIFYKNFSCFYHLDAPIKQKKAKFQEAQKLKQIVSRAVNQNIEEEMRKRAYEGQTSLSKVQEVVAKHHQSKEKTSSEDPGTSGS